MSPRVVAMPTMSSKNWPTWNVADAVTGFMAGSHVDLDNLPCIFSLDIYMVILSRLHNSKDVSVTPTAPERVVPIVGIIQKTHGRTCDVHHFGGSTVLLSVRTVHGFSGLLRGPGNNTGWTHHLFCSRLCERSFKFLFCILISFILDIRKN